MFLRGDFLIQHMKGTLPPFTIGLLICSVCIAGCVLDKSDTNEDADPILVSFAQAVAQMQNPIGSACDSPIFYIINSLYNTDNEKKVPDKDHCYQAEAVALGDTAQCWNINRGAPKTKCFLLIAAKKNDISICDQIPETSDMQAYLKVDCLWEVAMKNNNPAACNAMGNERISRMFIGEMSMQTCNQRLAGGQAAGGSLT